MTSTSVKLSTSNTTSDSIAFGKDSSNSYGYIAPNSSDIIPFNKPVYYESCSINTLKNYTVKYDGLLVSGGPILPNESLAFYRYDIANNGKNNYFYNSTTNGVFNNNILLVLKGALFNYIGSENLNEDYKELHFYKF